MQRDVLHTRMRLPYDKDEIFQTFGEWSFFRSGAVQLGLILYAYRTPIHRERFGANLTAIRDANDPTFLAIETPFGRTLRFQYRPLLRRWYQIVEIDDPWVYAVHARFGARIAICAYLLNWFFWSAFRCLAILVLWTVAVFATGFTFGVILKLLS